MKILFVSDNYAPFIKAGAEVSTTLLASELAQNPSNEVSVACVQHRDTSWVESGVTVYPIISNPTLKAKGLGGALFSGVWFVILQILSARRVLRLIKQIRPDVINFVLPSRFHPIIIYIRLFSRCPIVVDCRAYDLICPAHLSPTHLGKPKKFIESEQTHHGYHCVGYTSASDVSILSIRPFAMYESFIFNFYKYSIRFLLNHFDGMHLVAVSEFVRQQLILNGFRADRITTIHNISRSGDSVPEQEYPQITTFAYAGRIEKDKGVFDMLSAAEIILRESKVPFEVKIAGAGGASQAMQEYVKEHGLSNVSLLGHVTQHEVSELYSKSSVIIGPSRWPEPFGRFILDAISAGKPVIATRAGGCIEGISHGVTGMLVEVENAEQLAQAMKFFLENPDHAKVMKSAIVEKQKYFRGEYIGTKRLTLYQNLCYNHIPEH